MDSLGTWNVLITPAVMALATGIIVNSINRHFKVRDDKDTKIAAMIKDRDDRREAQRDREHASLHATLCTVKTKVESIEDELRTKVEFEYCKEQERIIQKRITEHIENHHTRRSTDRWPIGPSGSG